MLLGVLAVFQAYGIAKALGSLGDSFIGCGEGKTHVSAGLFIEGARCDKNSELSHLVNGLPAVLTQGCPDVEPGFAIANFEAISENGLEQHWSPEEICGRLPVEFPDDVSMRVVPETIYQALFVQRRRIFLNFIMMPKWPILHRFTMMLRQIF